MIKCEKEVSNFRKTCNIQLKITSLDTTCKVMIDMHKIDVFHSKCSSFSMGFVFNFLTEFVILIKYLVCFFRIYRTISFYIYNLSSLTVSIISSPSSCLSKNLPKRNTSKTAAIISCILLHLL